MSGTSQQIEFTEIAADWDSIALGEESPQALLTIRNGLTTKQTQGDGDYKVSRIETIGGGWIDDKRVRFVSELKECDAKKYRIQKGDILFSHINSEPHLGKTGIAERDYSDLLHGMNLLLIRPNPEVFDPQFLNRVFQYYRDIGVFISICSRAVNQSSINQAKMKAFKVPLPPLPEQKKIAYILSTVQQAIEAQERIITTTTELKKALMQKLFTEGLRGEPQKQTDIGPVPESWELFSVDNLFEMQLGKMLSPKAKVGNSPRPYLRNKNVQWGCIDTGDLFRMDFNEREMTKFRLWKDDLLVCEGGEIGRTAIWHSEIEECYYQKALHRLRPKDDRISNEFMSHWMMFSFLLNNTYGVTGTRTTIAHLPVTKFKPLLVPVPAHDEQLEIITVLKNADTKIANHRRKVQSYRDLFRTLLHELMTAKIRVHDLEFPGLEKTA